MTLMVLSHLRLYYLFFTDWLAQRPIFDHMWVFFAWFESFWKSL